MAGAGNLTNAQRQTWAKTIIATLKEKAISMSLINTNLQEMGSATWKIVSAGSLSSADVSDSVAIEYQGLSDSLTTVTTNFDKRVAWIDLDTDGVSTDIAYLTEFVAQSSNTLAGDWDTAVFGVYGDAGTDFYSSGTTAWQFTLATCANIPAFFAKLAKVAKDNNWPDGDNYIVGPSGLKEAILTYSGGRATPLGDNIIGSATVAKDAMRFMGFNVFFSNRLTTDTNIMGLAGPMGDGIAGAAVTNPNSITSMPAESQEGTLYRARLRGGYKVYRSAAVAAVHFNTTVVATS